MTTANQTKSKSPFRAKDLWFVVYVSVALFWLLCFWMTNNGLQFHNPSVNFAAWNLLVLSPLLILAAVWQLAPPGLVKKLSQALFFVLLVCAMLFGCLVLLQVCSHDAYDDVKTPPDLRCKLSDGRTIDICPQYDSARTEYLNCRERNGFFFDKVKTRVMTGGKFLAVRPLPGGKALIIFKTALGTTCTYDLDEFLNHKGDFD